MENTQFEDRHLKLNEVKKMAGYGHTKIYQMINDNEFPPPKKHGGSSRWLLSEVQAFLHGTWKPVISEAA